MFIAIKKNKIIDYNETGKFPCLVYDRIEKVEDAEMVEVGGEFVLKTDDKAIAKQKNKVRAVRNQYLEIYIDPFQLVIRWRTLSEQEQTDLVNYRQYLLDYTEQENWWESEPLTYEEWKEKEAN